MTDPVRLLRADLGEALVDAGFSLHDCADPGTPAGGVCLTPSTVGPYHDGAGLIVSWSVGEALRDDARYLTYRAVLDEMNTTLGVLLLELGFDVRPFGQGGAHVVIGRRPSGVEAPDDLALDLLG